MRKILLGLAIVASIAVMSCKNEEKTEVQTTTDQGKELSVINFGVRGNCGMCKTTIEKAAKSVDGVVDANWDMKKKSIKVSYDEAKVKEGTIHKVIAYAGYDTEKMSGEKESYKKLPKCGQNPGNMKMNQ